MATQNHASCSEIQYGNFGKCACLDNGVIRLIASLSFGPRILSFSTVGNRNILFEDTDRSFTEPVPGYGEWIAYGGHRLWISPELKPETYYPDNEPVESSFADGVLTLTAKPTAFGKQFILRIRMNPENPNSVTIENIVRNLSDRAQVFAPWSITSLTPGGTEFVPLTRAERGFLPNRTMVLWSYSHIDDPRFRLTDSHAVLTQDRANTAAFKAGFNVEDGYAVYILGNQVFRKSFGEYGSLTYPDFGCNFETYTNEKFLECELLGELGECAPGGQTVLTENWEICETDQTPDAVLADLIARHEKSK